MKNSFLLFTTFLCLAASCAECYDPLWQHLLKTKESQKVYNHLTSENRISKEEDLAVFVGPQEGRREGDKIDKLAGQPPHVKFSQYSGYVTVDLKADRELFYYFAEAENPTINKPLVLWLNGGPGCSSMGAGAMMELGPFRVNPDGKTLSYNQHAWNKVANVLFLESPAGVGFSYSKRSSDYVTGDKQTAADTYTFLLNWFERFPQYKSRDFFLAGEGYAGHYIPQLADLILSNNKNTKHTVIKLKGLVIGNAHMDDEDLDVSLFNFMWTRALISDETHSKIIKYCDFSPGANYTRPCLDSLNTAFKEMGDIDLYNIYAPICLNGSSAATPSGMFDPCSDYYVYTYLNTNEVQKALHASVDGITRPWEVCSDKINGNWTGGPVTVIPVVKKLMMSNNVRIWIYSGDTDAVISVTTTKSSLHKLSANVKTAWYPWYHLAEVGGYAVGYDHNLMFVTIRGAGHMVPNNQPQRALAMFTSFLQGKSPPSKN